MIEKFATDCCLYSVLDKSFDLRDANSVRYASNSLLWQPIFAMLNVNCI
jgi:exportin-T